MRLIQQTDEHYEFELSSREKVLLFQVLELYPQVPGGYQHLSKTADPEEANQRLLEETLSETRAQNKRALQQMLTDPNKLSSSDTQWRLHLSSAELDWLLAVLNDIRIGSWVRLGSPEVPLAVLTAGNASYYWALEMAGYFQGGFLELLER